MLKAIRSKGPTHGKEHFVAYTDWLVSWSFEFKRVRRFGQRSAFAVSAPSVTVRVIVTLPTWKAPSNAPEELRASWTRARAAIESHEAEHAALALKAGES